MVTYTTNKLVDEAMALMGLRNDRPPMRDEGSGAIGEREAKARPETGEACGRVEPGASLWERSECKKRQAPVFHFGKKEERQ